MDLSKIGSIPFSRGTSQKLVASFAHGTSVERVEALAKCQQIANGDINAFCTNILPAALQLGKILDPIVRLALTHLIEVIYCKLDSANETFKFPVLASCLEALVLFLNDADIRLKKAVILVVSRSYPVIFKHFCTLASTDPQYWALLNVLKSRVDELLLHDNEGVKICAINCLQTFILVQSYRDPSVVEESISLDICPANHAFINKQQLEGEAINLLNKFITVLSQASTVQLTSGFIMAIMNGVFQITKSRPQFALHCTSAVLDIFKAPPAYLTPTQRKSIEKTLRAILLMSVSIPSVGTLEPVIADVLIRLGMRPIEIQAKFRRDQKRLLEEDELEQEAKRFRGELEEGDEGVDHIDLQKLILQNGRLDELPLELIADVIVETLFNRPASNWQQDVSKFMNEHFPPPVVPKADGPSRDPRKRANVDQAQAVKAAQVYQQQVSAYQQELVAAKGFVAQFIEQLKPIHPDIFSQMTFVTDARDQDEEEDQEVDTFQDVVGGSNSTDDTIELLKDCFARVLDANPFFVVQSLPGAKPPAFISKTTDTMLAARLGWSSLVVRLASMESPIAKHVEKVLLRFILMDFKKRIDLGVFWLFEVYRQVKQSSNMDRYNRVFTVILNGLKGTRPGNDEHEAWMDGLDPKDRMFTKFLVEAPYVPQIGLDRVLKYCADDERMILGIATLRDLAIYRPAMRDDCMDHLLKFCNDHNKKPRDMAIAVVKRFYPDHPAVSDLIESTGLKGLETFVEKYSQEKMETDAEISPEELEASLALIDLFFALVSRNNSLIERLMQSYQVLTPLILEHVGQSATPVFKEMAAEPAMIYKLIGEFPSGSEELLLIGIQELLSAQGLTPELLSTLNNSCRSKNLDARFIKFIVSDIPKNDVLHYLPRIISGLAKGQNEDLVKAIFTKVLVVIGTEENADAEVTTKKVRLTPAELLVKLHQMESEDARKALDLCLGMKSIFTVEVLAIALQQLADMSKLSSLFMGTALQCLTLYKTLSSFMNTILIRLKSKKIWSDLTLWEGYIELCSLAFPGSLSVLLSLPKEQGLDVLTKSTSLQNSVSDYLAEIPDAQRGRRDIVMLQVLLSESKGESLEYFPETQ